MNDPIPESFDEHIKNPIGKDVNLQSQFTIKNSCGDQFIMGWIDNKLIWNGSGCVLSQVSASILAKTINGVDANDALILVNGVIRVLKHESPVGTLNQPDLNDLYQFQRTGCSILPWILARSVLNESS